MARLPRIVAVGYPHHLTQRGNNKQEIFLDDDDCNKYLSFLSEYCRKYKLVILSYCLMPNHIHLLAVPEEKFSLAKTIKCTHMRYAQYVNKKVNACGHLWHRRFHSCVLNQRHLFAAARYIERNPVRAEIVKEAWVWEWSSARYHIGKEKKNEIITGNLFDYINVKPSYWKECLKMYEKERYIQKIRKHTKRGHTLH
ncbi:MAG: transposase [Candidatus Saganbacteria bacterium]|nr:transposase [Candidatus Saganbacteria bacterium]